MTLSIKHVGRVKDRVYIRDLKLYGEIEEIHHDGRSDFLDVRPDEKDHCLLAVNEADLDFLPY